MATNYPDDATERTTTTLESDDMDFMGYASGTNAPLRTSYSTIKDAIGGGGGSDYILIRDVKTSGTDGGTFTAGADQTRDLTEITSDSGGHASLSTNQITLAAGTYTFSIRAPGSSCYEHQAWLYNVSTSSIISAGTNGYASATGTQQTHSIISGMVVFASETVLEIRHRCKTTKTTDGFGQAGSFATTNEEVYTVAEFWKTA